MWFKKRIDILAAEVDGLRQSVQNSASLAEEKSAGIGEQLTKLTRLTYKNGKDTADKLDRMAELLAQSDSGWKVAFEQEQAQRTKDQGVMQSTAAAMIQWVDDLDAVIEGTGNSPIEGWEQVLRHWLNQLLEHLTALGVHEVLVYGQTFDPRTCEGAGTVPEADMPDGTLLFPYQVVRVLKRGYRLTDGALIRKAQVITIEEEKPR
ncbi:nucleotide exchange factor GrpE [Paenibacillus sp. BR2-3]|uniref:nucleotide exchange factor GrpE n=1 Tax=Paenibacillus sp. BR2-3 TaxID=3048494 RepID=UPI0039777F7B